MGDTTATIDPLGNEEDYFVDLAGNVTGTEDADGNLWQTFFDELSRVTATIDPEMNEEDTEYNEDGVEDIINGAGLDTHYAYDWAHHTQTTTLGYGTGHAQATTGRLNDAGLVTQTVDSLTHTRSSVFDANELLSQIKDNNNLVKETFGYTSAGETLTTKDALNNIVTSLFDGLRRRIGSLDPNGDSTGETLDAFGEAWFESDGAGEQSRTIYDNDGEVLAEIDAQGARTEFTYDNNGNRVRMKDAAGNVTQWIYDKDNRQVKEIDPLGNESTQSFDAAGYLTVSVDRLGREKDYDYYDNGWLHTETWKDSLGTAVNTITYAYEGDGQVHTISDANGTITYDHDDLGRLETYTDVWGNTLDYLYDGASRVTAVIDSFGGEIDYRYDSTDHLTTVTFSDGTSEFAIIYHYNDRDEVEEVDRYSDAAHTTLVSKTEYGYDDGGRLEAIGHETAGSVIIDEFDYSYDAADRVVSEDSTLGPSRSYDYDDSGQLLNDGTDSYTYDANGNRTMTGYVTGDANQLTTDGTWDYTYDAAGDMTQKAKISNGEVWQYGYDNNNRLTKAEHRPTAVSAVDDRVEYKYDANGGMIQRSVDADGDGAGSAVITKFGMDANGNVFADLSSGGSLTTRRFYDNAPDSQFARMDTGTGDVNFLLTDNLGSIRDIISGTGTLLDHRDWDSYGNLVNETGSGSDRYGWTGREWDAEIELQYNRARWYDPTTGRWISQDPTGFDAGDGNLYRYVTNSPVSRFDPFGLDFIAVGTRDVKGLGGFFGHMSLAYFECTQKVSRDFDLAMQSFGAVDFQKDVDTGAWLQKKSDKRLDLVKASFRPLETVKSYGARRVAGVELLVASAYAKKRIDDSGKKLGVFNVNVSIIRYSEDGEKFIPVYEGDDAKKLWDSLMANGVGRYPYAEQPDDAFKTVPRLRVKADGRINADFPLSAYGIPNLVTDPKGMKVNNSNSFVTHFVTQLDDFSANWRKRSSRVFGNHPGAIVPSALNVEDWSWERGLWATPPDGR